ncbi:MAG: glycosyltransferase family 9 protein [Candidatus Omnitrophota bacterium]
MNKKKIKKILFITLSNLGDIILTTPVLEKLHEEFPCAGIDVMTGLPGKEIFALHPAVDHVLVNQRRRHILDRLRQLFYLRGKKYDMVVDLKNSLMPYLLGAEFHSQLSLRPKSGHKHEEHLSKLLPFEIDVFSNIRFFVPSSENDKKYAEEIIEIKENALFSGIQGKTKKNVIINPGAKSHLKRWPESKYSELADVLAGETGARIFFTGDMNDKQVICGIIKRMAYSAKDLSAGTSIGVLFELMKRMDLVITNDSAPLHIASAAQVPTVAIFGPTDECKYGPLADNSRVIVPNVSCRPCSRAQCAKGIKNGCISEVKVDDVFDAASKILGRMAADDK